MSGSLTFFYLLLSTLCLFRTSTAAAASTTTEEESKDGEQERSLPDTVTWTPPTPFGQTTEYFVVTKPWLNASEAKKYCESLSAKHYLCGIESQGEFTYLKTQLLNLVGPSLKYNRNAFWLSGVDPEKNSIRGSALQVWYYFGILINTAFWAPGEPNDSPNGTGCETCINAKKPASGTQEFWINDEKCSSELSFICEKKTSPRQTPANA